METNDETNSGAAVNSSDFVLPPRFVVEVRIPGLSARWEADADQVKRLANFTSDLILAATKTGESRPTT